MRWLVLFWLLVVAPLRADSWGPPEPEDIFSGNRSYLLHIEPVKTSHFALVLARSQQRQIPGRCLGTLYRLEGKKRVRVWSGALVNEVAPLSAIVSDDGRYVVTLDNYAMVGLGSDVVAAYGPSGKPLWKKSLTDLLPEDEIRKMDPGPSGIWWRHGQWFDLVAEQVVVVSRGRMICIGLADGAVSQGGAESLRRAMAQYSVPAEAVELLTEQPLRDLGPRLWELLLGRDTTLKVRAAFALSVLGDEQAKAFLRRAALRGPERNYILENLPSALGQDAIPVLITGLESNSSVYYAGLGLEAVGKPARPALEAVLATSSSAEARAGAAETLSKLGDPEAKPALLRAVNDPDEEVAKNALNGLVRLVPNQESLAPEFARALEQGTAQDDWLGMYFSEVLYLPSQESLIIALGRKQVEKDWLFRALQFQTGMDFGHDVEAWRKWVHSGLGADRGGLAVVLGDPGGFLWRSATASELTRYPRLLAVLTDAAGVESLELQGSRLLIGGWVEHQGWDLTTGAKLEPNRDVGPDRQIKNKPFENYADLVDGKGKPIVRMSGKSRRFSARFSPSRRRVLTVDADQVAVWDAHSGHLLAEFSGRAITLSHDDRTAAVREREGYSLWDVESGKRLSLLKHSDAVELSFSPDDKMVAWQSGSGLTLAALPSGKPVELAHPRMTEYSWSPDSTLLVSSGYDAALKLWTRQGKLLTQVRGGRDGKLGGHTLVFWKTQELSTLEVWAVNPPRFLFQIRDRGDNGLSGFELSADGQRLAFVSGNTARVYELFPSAALPAGPGLAELWLGLRLDGDRLIELTTEEYYHRVNAWNAAGLPAWSGAF
ncbi:MAG: hypothetical protein AMXMBFR33_68300 [Candidatus Xenobia bacterium]